MMILMIAHGNGSVHQCVENLLKCFRGEIPFERVKGLDPRMVDQPLATVEMDIIQDAEWLLETYEPRAEVSNIFVTQSNAGVGNFSITAEIET